MYCKQFLWSYCCSTFKFFPLKSYKSKVSVWVPHFYFQRCFVWRNPSVAPLCNLQYAAETISTGTRFLHLALFAQARRSASATFLTSQHRCQWLAGLTIDPSHHIKVSISAAEFIGGTSSWKSGAVHSSRRCPKEWQVLKPLQGG